MLFRFIHTVYDRALRARQRPNNPEAIKQFADAGVVGKRIQGVAEDYPQGESGHAFIQTFLETFIHAVTIL